MELLVTAMSSDGVTVLVTGASRGRGEVTSRLLDRIGAKIVIGLLVLGDSYEHTRYRGVDGEALDWALSRHVPYVVEHADKTLPRAERFKPRNLRMAEHLSKPTDWAIALPAEFSRGTWQTLGFAKARHVNWFISMPDGTERWGHS
jgi:NAD(P)-dependent dehydrogenase (short-subunit alcohol dehydrogenase family)